MRKTISGFTIVELLIVIVVIAILAAISIVAYNGIQVRAQNTSTISNVRNMVNALQMYQMDSSTLNANTVTKNRLCLGSPNEYPAIAGVAAGKCRSDNGFTTYRADPQFEAVMSPIASVKGSTPLVQGADGTLYRGLWYDNNNNTQPALYYALKGSGQSCGMSGAIATNTNGITQCRVNIELVIRYCVPGDTNCS